MPDADSESKRSSALSMGGVDDTLPTPDGTIAAADRIHLTLLYAGIAAEAPAPTAIPWCLVPGNAPNIVRRNFDRLNRILKQIDDRLDAGGL